MGRSRIPRPVFRKSPYPAKTECDATQLHQTNGAVAEKEEETPWISVSIEKLAKMKVTCEKIRSKLRTRIDKYNEALETLADDPPPRKRKRSRTEGVDLCSTSTCTNEGENTESSSSFSASSSATTSTTTATASTQIDTSLPPTTTSIPLTQTAANKITIIDDSKYYAVNAIFSFLFALWLIPVLISITNLTTTRHHLLAFIAMVWHIIDFIAVTAIFCSSMVLYYIYLCAKANIMASAFDPDADFDSSDPDSKEPSNSDQKQGARVRKYENTNVRIEIVSSSIPITSIPHPTQPYSKHRAKLTTSFQPTTPAKESAHENTHLKLIRAAARLGMVVMTRETKEMLERKVRVAEGEVEKARDEGFVQGLSYYHDRMGRPLVGALDTEAERVWEEAWTEEVGDGWEDVKVEAREADIEEEKYIWCDNIVLGIIDV